MKPIRTYLESEEFRYLYQNLIKSASGTLFLRVSFILISLVGSIFLARILGAENYGVYSYSIILINLLVIIANFGFPILLVRETAANLTNSKWELLKGLLKRSNQIIIFFSIFLILLCYIYTSVFRKYYGQYSITSFQIALILVPILSLNAIRAASLRGFGKVILSQIPENIIRPGLIALIVLIIYVFYKDLNINAISALWINIISTLFGLGFGIYFLRKNLHPNIFQVKSEYRDKQWFKSLLPFFFLTVFQFLNNQIDILMVGWFLEATEIGIYRIITLGTQLLLFGMIAIDMALAPLISKLYTLKDLKHLDSVIYFSVKALVVFTLPIVIIFIVFRQEILLYIFGSDFIQGAIAFAILAISIFLTLCFGCPGVVLDMTGNEKYNFKSVVISLIINSILNLILIPILGITGAAIAKGISLITLSVILVLYVKNILGINTSIFRLSNRMLSK